MNQEMIRIDDKTISLSDVLNSVREIIYVTDKGGKLVSIYGNEIVKTGIGNNNHLGKLISEIFEFDENHIHTSSHRRCLNGESFSFEWELNFNSNTYYYRTFLSPIQNDLSEISGITGMIRNISKEKALNRFHEEIEMMFRTLTNAAKSAIVSVNEIGAIEYCNPAAGKLFEYKQNELLGKEFSVLFYNEDLTSDTDADGKIKMDQEFFNTLSFEMRGLKKSGEQFPIECNISPYDILNIRHRVIIIQDISERKLVEEQRKSYQNNLEKKNKEIQDALEYTKMMQNQLVHSEKMASLGALISGIAHEINNPLAFVASNLNRFDEYFADLFILLDKWKSLGQNLNKPEHCLAELHEIDALEKKIDYEFIVSDCKELMKHNFEGIERIKKIVIQLRGFAHISDDHAIDADINKAIDETLIIVWNEIKYKATVKKIYGDIPQVQCHIGEIKQIFVNLLVNAAQAIETKGEIKIETFNDDDNVIIKIIDTGKGMNDEIKRKVFDPFFTTKAIGEGSGLGLWICMSLIHKHNGKLEVKSQEGLGTTFTITLPMEFKSNNNYE